MKQRTALFAILVTALIVSACGGPVTSVSPASSEPPTEAAPPAPPEPLYQIETISPNVLWVTGLKWDAHPNDPFVYGFGAALKAALKEIGESYIILSVEGVTYKVGDGSETPMLIVIVKPRNVQ